MAGGPMDAPPKDARTRPPLNLLAEGVADDFHGPIGLLVVAKVWNLKEHVYVSPVVSVVKMPNL